MAVSASSPASLPIDLSTVYGFVFVLVEFLVENVGTLIIDCVVKHHVGERRHHRIRSMLAGFLRASALIDTIGYFVFKWGTFDSFLSHLV